MPKVVTNESEHIILEIKLKLKTGELAIGFIASRAAANVPTFGATWDHIAVTPGVVAAEAAGGALSPLVIASEAKQSSRPVAPWIASSVCSSQ